MKILLAASEVAPIIKIGGLGDVIGSLPKALEKIGVNPDVVIPFYPAVSQYKGEMYKSMEIHVPFGGENNVVEVYKTKLPNSNVDVFLLKNDAYFSTGGTNFYAKSVSETQMFAFFDRAVVEFIKSGFNTYDLIHCNDWHTGLVTHILEDEIPESRPATLFTIHNLMYQGIGNESLVRDIGFVPGTHPILDWDIQDGDLNMVQQGIASSDYINAVSPSYAKEVLTEKYGGFLASVLKARQSRLSGILNGLDYAMFPRKYDVSTWEQGKKEAKKELIKKLKLDIDYDQPLFSFIGRIDPNQKGIKLIYEAIPYITQNGGGFCLLGTGDKKWEKKLGDLSSSKTQKNPISIITKFDIELANLMYSGSDFLLVPSKYEPCGLIQLIALWYGSLPIVHGVGGLKDTIVDEENGFVFTKYSTEELIASIKKAFKLYFNKNSRDRMVVNALKCDFSWGESARKYKELYKKVIAIRKTAHE